MCVEKKKVGGREVGQREAKKRDSHKKAQKETKKPPGVWEVGHWGKSEKGPVLGGGGS